MRLLSFAKRVAGIIAAISVCWGCSTANPEAPALDASGKHPDGWVSQGDHTVAYYNNPDQCQECHGADYRGGISRVSCFSPTLGGRSCHATFPPECIDCHGVTGSPDFDNFDGNFWNDGTISRIRLDGEWNKTGHGRPPSEGKYFSKNPAAAFTAAGDCKFCHDQLVKHRDAGNPFRLRKGVLGDVSDTGFVCLNCHVDGSPGVTIGNVNKNGSKKVKATHFGLKHQIPGSNNGGFFCWDCHDAHGDRNIFMIHNQVAKTSDVTTGAPTMLVFTNFTAFATGTDYARSAAPFTGICNVCHTTTNHYTSGSGDGHNAGTRCSTTCHPHDGDAATTGDIFSAFKPVIPHGFPFPGSSHMGPAGAPPFPDCVVGGCHTNTVGNRGNYPVPVGTPPDCQGCHTKLSPGNGCGSCHGPAAGNGRPNGNTFPDIKGRHNDPSEHRVVCSTCHGANGSGEPTHGPSNRTAHTAADVNLQPTGEAAGMTFVRNGGNVTCNGRCHENHENKRWFGGD